jgi:homoserine O-acetyltransferase
LPSLIAQLAKDPNWNDGRYYDKGGIVPTLTAMRINTLKLYGIDDQLAAVFPDSDARDAELRRRAEAWAREFDGNSLVVLRRASIRFDAEKDLGKLKARVLYVLSRTDKVFPPSIAPAVMEKLKGVGASAEYVEIDSALGHSASGLDAAKWAPNLKTFMAQLERRS